MAGTWKRKWAIVVCATLLGVAVAAITEVGRGDPARATARDPKTSSVSPLVSASTATAPLTKPLVILYGDSLAWEAEDSFVGAFAGRPEVQVLTRTWGGTAICDWLDEMRADAATFAPGVVVLEFSGNALTLCMQDSARRGLSGDAYWARYRADTQARSRSSSRRTPGCSSSAPRLRAFRWRRVTTTAEW